ncbi:hypothetical protein KAOT1_19762 [Kordia algicida OT-1]|uniref:Uncharacterized protein n=1 Tax=Kordia algicida OT-1 TaxID=391587 RepID=A9DPG9_9FLAO|nr:hypothetical protein KAOT1_19762 [Kordia algicida OT-1]
MKNVNLKPFVNVTKTYKGHLIRKYATKVRKTNVLRFH